MGVENRNLIELDRDGHLYWNDAPIHRVDLQLYMHAIAEIKPLPLTLVKADPQAKCGTLRDITSDIASAVPCTASTCRLDWRLLPHDSNRPEANLRM
ncbi:MAG: hypothetical protein P0Y59_02130 [Candidatus Sphingomonas phytovorans]|nr:hypothetical protein [Sphingomonas sp.]WEK00514.1 MAG: hypothetical protein P0Y59_02130 [Sphingomonas sp.]